MTKEQMIDHISTTTDISKRQASDALEAFMGGITLQLQKDEKISFAGFGTFSISHRKARTGRNPQTGEPLQIPASKVPVFKAGKHLKDAVKK